MLCMKVKLHVTAPIVASIVWGIRDRLMMIERGSPIKEILHDYVSEKPVPVACCKIWTYRSKQSVATGFECPLAQWH